MGTVLNQAANCLQRSLTFELWCFSLHTTCTVTVSRKHKTLKPAQPPHAAHPHWYTTLLYCLLAPTRTKQPRQLSSPSSLQLSSTISLTLRLYSRLPTHKPNILCMSSSKSAQRLFLITQDKAGSAEQAQADTLSQSRHLGIPVLAIQPRCLRIGR